MRTKPITDHAERWARIEAAMDRANIRTQKELATALKVSAPTVSGWKNGDFMPNLDNMIELARLSGYCLEWLVVGRGPRYPDDGDPRHQEFIDVLDSLDDDTVKDVLDFARWRKSKDRGDT